MSDLSPLCAPKRTPADHSEFTGSRLDDEVKRGCDRTHAGLSERGWAKRVGWMERLVRRSSTSEGGSDTHQLHLMEMMGFAGSTHPTH